MKKAKNLIILIILFYVITGSVAATFLYLEKNPKKPAATVAQTTPVAEETAEVSEAEEPPVTEPVSEPEKPAETPEEPIVTPEETPAQPETTPETTEPEETPEVQKPVEETPVAEEPEEVHYYAFKTTHTQRRLNVRETPSMTGKVLGQLEQKSSGYVLEKGDEWCKIEFHGLIGYSTTQFLDVYEITKEEFENR